MLSVKKLKPGQAYLRVNQDFCLIYSSVVFISVSQQFSEAAQLYEKGQYYDKAASVYIRSKNWWDKHSCTVTPASFSPPL